jgi:hypothetical protein
MKIGYRRWSMKIGLSENEDCTIGGWLEKRKATTTELEKRGHQIFLLSQPTKTSIGLWSLEKNKEEKLDALFFEFSGLNEQFYGKEIEETKRIIKKYNCPFFFILDDPDIIPKLYEFDKQFTVLINSNINEEKRYLFNYHFFQGSKNISIEPFPVHSLMEIKEYKENSIEFPVYYGNSSGGRLKVLESLMFYEKILVYGKQKNFNFKVNENIPTQPERSKFYQQFLYSIALSDNKHKIWEWNTGRAFHSIIAGVPTVFEGNNPLSKKFIHFKTYSDIQRCRFEILENRKSIVETQQLELKKDYFLLDKTLKKYGI